MIVKGCGSCSQRAGRLSALDFHDAAADDVATNIGGQNAAFTAHAGANIGASVAVGTATGVLIWGVTRALDRLFSKRR